MGGERKAESESSEEEKIERWKTLRKVKKSPTSQSTAFFRWIRWSWLIGGFSISIGSPLSLFPLLTLSLLLPSWQHMQIREGCKKKSNKNSGLMPNLGGGQPEPIFDFDEKKVFFRDHIGPF